MDMMEMKIEYDGKKSVDDMSVDTKTKFWTLAEANKHCISLGYSNYITPIARSLGITMNNSNVKEPIKNWNGQANGSEHYSRSDTTKHLLRDFLTKAEASKNNQAMEERNRQRTLALPSPSKKFKFDLTNSGTDAPTLGHTSVIQSTSNTSVHLKHHINYNTSSVNHCIPNTTQQTSRANQNRYNPSINTIASSAPPVVSSYDAYNKTHVYTNRHLQQEEQSVPLDLGISKPKHQSNNYSASSSNNCRPTALNLSASSVNSVIFREKSPVRVINTPAKTLTVDSSVTEVSSSVESPTSEYPNSNIKLTPRHLKKAWLDRHTGDDVIENVNSMGIQQYVNHNIDSNSFVPNIATPQYPNCNRDSTPSVPNKVHLNLINKPIDDIPCDVIKKEEIKLECINESGNLNYDISKDTNGKIDMKSKHGEKLYVRKLFSKDKVVKKVMNKNGIKLNDAAVDILKQAKKFGNNNNHALSKDIWKENKKIGLHDEEVKKEYDDDKIRTNGELTSSMNKNFHKEKDVKKHGFTFLQDGPCFQVAPKLSKCRECRWTQNQDLEDVNNIFCRFSSFRKLRYTKNFMLATAGFSDPYEDPSEEDVSLWLPDQDNLTADLDLEMSHFILRHVGDQFCDLVEQEKQAAALNVSDDNVVAWKKLVKGVREMCDVCETTLFNVHWTCAKCGFIVCLDCYKHRRNDTGRLLDAPGRDHDEFNWLLCTNRSSHELSKLMLTQIIPGDSLTRLGEQMHKTRGLWNFEQNCGCSLSKCKQKHNPDSIQHRVIQKLLKCSISKNGNFMMSSDASVKMEDQESNNDVYSDTSSCDSDMEDTSLSSFRNMLLNSNSDCEMMSIKVSKPLRKKRSRLDVMSDVISAILGNITVSKETSTPIPLKHFTRRFVSDTKPRESRPVRVMTMVESSSVYQGIPHSWLCDGKLLRLLEANHPGNYRIFQDQWKRGQPVLVSNVSDLLDMKLWHPDRFAADFGEEKNDLINCMNGKIVPNQPMGKFWEGFEHFSKRLKDDDGYPMLLKLKDWPPGEDFAELLPTRFQDLIKALPLGEYTKRNGRLNLAGFLPECFVRPDLGPKMYNAYGSALHPTKGTTNLHMDISDAVNVMVYVGIPKDGDDDEHIKEALRAIDEAGCDILTRRRVRNKCELPGALWHIYTACDADKIRDLLNKVALEQGKRLEPHHDPIHDQNWYLDGYLRERLYKEYGVEGYAIVQCRGDAVFIPAGAPHQVRNLHNCIKVAEDFVSPENVSHCFHLTQEFRDLSDTHTNHEDKLQIKNIIYHAVKDALACMSGTMKEALTKELKDSKV